MSLLTLRRIHLGEPCAAEQLARLRDELGGQGNAVSEGSRPLSRKSFAAPITPHQVVEHVCDNVRRRRLPAALDYTEHFDRIRLTPETLRVTPAEMHLAHAAADPGFLD